MYSLMEEPEMIGSFIWGLIETDFQLTWAAFRA